MVMEAEPFPGPDLAAWEASTQNDPERATELTEQALAAAPAPPTIDPPPSPVVELPGGWFSPLGELHRQAMVRELTGRDEEAIARLDAVKHPSALIRTITKLGVTEIGGEPPSDLALGMLLVGDRNALVLGIRRVTLGDQLPMDIECPSCGASETLTIELDKDIPNTVMDDPAKRVFDVEISRGAAKVTLATAEVEDHMLDMTKSTPPERNTYMLERCVLELNGAPPSREQILDLPMPDRRKLVDTLIDEQPGPQYSEVKLPCGSCAREFPLALTLGDLFRY